ncbi:MAG: hypothetical protein AAGJ38_06970 [Planctomycetota bacterium]
MNHLLSHIIAGLHCLSGLPRSVWRWFPEVRPYTGPASLHAKPGQTVRVFNGRVIVTSLRKR